MHEVETIRLGCGKVMLWGEIMLILGEVMYTLEVETNRLEGETTLCYGEFCCMQLGKTILSCGEV